MSFWESGTAGALVSGAFGLLNRRSVPKPMTANQMVDRMDTMYPGTTPWERLGAQGGGVPSASASQDQAKMQAEVMQQQHRNQLAITHLNNKTAKEVADIQAESAENVAEHKSPIKSVVKDVVDKVYGMFRFVGEQAEAKKVGSTRRLNTHPKDVNKTFLETIQDYTSDVKQIDKSGRSRKGRNK